MRILTDKNYAYPMSDLNKETNECFCSLDYSDEDNVDYYWWPLKGLEIFTSPSVELEIMGLKTQVPFDWSIMVGEKEFGDVETIPVTSLSTRQFNAFVFNPFNFAGSLKGYMPQFYDVSISMVYPDNKWILPRLKSKNFLAVPIEIGYNPLCAFFCKDVTKLPESLDVSKLI